MLHRWCCLTRGPGSFAWLAYDLSSQAKGGRASNIEVTYTCIICVCVIKLPMSTVELSVQVSDSISVS